MKIICQIIGDTLNQEENKRDESDCKTQSPRRTESRTDPLTWKTKSKHLPAQNQIVEKQPNRDGNPLTQNNHTPGRFDGFYTQQTTTNSHPDFVTLKQNQTILNPTTHICTNFYQRIEHQPSMKIRNDVPIARKRA